MHTPPLRDTGFRARRLWFEQWRRRHARQEYRRFLSHHTCGTADGYKDNPHRPQSPGEYNEEAVRRAGDPSTLTEKKRDLREKWNLPSTADIHP